MDAREVLAIVLNRGLQPKIGEFGLLEFDGDLRVMTEPLAAVVKYHEDAIKRLVASQWTPDVRGVAGVAPKVPLTPSEESSRFDWDAERLVRDLYATDHGIRWKDGAMTIFPSDGDARLDAWFKRAKPMRERIEMHIRPRDIPTPETIAKCKAIGLDATKYTHGIELKHKDGGKVLTARHAVRQKGKKEEGSTGVTPDASDRNNKSRGKDDGPIIRYEPYQYTVQETWIFVVDFDHPFQWHPPSGYVAWRYMMDRCDHWRCLWGRHILINNHLVWVKWGDRHKDGSRFT